MPKPIPDDYPRVMAYLAVDGAKDAIAFYRDVFDASQRGDVMTMPDGAVAHAELQIGDSVVMLSDENPDWGNKGPKALGGSPVTMMIYVEDVDATVERAVGAGATQDTEVTNEFYGDRVGRVIDPFGYAWHIASHVEDVSDEEMERRVSAMFSG